MKNLVVKWNDSRKIFQLKKSWNAIKSKLYVDQLSIYVFLSKYPLHLLILKKVRQLTAANGALEKELVANKLVMMDALSETESLRSSLESVTKELADLKAEFAARDTAETERTLSAEVALRQKMQMEFEVLTRQYNDDKSTYTSRLEELGRTLAQADEQRTK